MRRLESVLWVVTACCGLILAYETKADEAALIDRLLELPAPVPDWRATAAKQAPPPGVDADDDELLDYLREREGMGERPIIDDNVRQKLLQICLKKPASIAFVVNYLPETPRAYDQLKGLYDRSRAEKDAEWREPLHDLLMMRSRYFRDDLVAAAKSLPNGTKPYEWEVTGSALEALALVDWKAAEPIILEQRQDQRVRCTTRALIIQYRHESSAGATAAADAVRTRLKAIVSDRTAPPSARDDACQALFSSQWPGREEYYLSLFGDPTLTELEDGSMLMNPLVGLVGADPNHWIPIVSKLVGNNDRAIHDNAVTCLIQFQNEKARADALEPLLPWLTDRQWSSARDRLRLIQSLDRVDLPQAVPGLIKVVENESGFELSGAAASLAHQHARGREVAAALRQAMDREKDEIHRREIARAMLVCGGLSDAEIVSAIEAYARQMSTEEGRKQVYATRDLADPQSISPQISLGEYLSGDAAGQPGVLTKLLARADSLGATQPDVASTIRLLVSDWSDAEVDRYFARRLAAGEVKDDELRALAGRATLMRKNAAALLRDICAKGGVWGGIAAGLLGENEVSAKILAGNDGDTQCGMLAIARLSRTPMPLADVGRLLESKTARIAHAAELYLISQDSAQARSLVLARHKGEAIILGGRSAFDPGHNTFAPLGKTAETLRADVRKAGGPDEIFALISEGYWGGNGQIIIRLHRAAGKESAMMTLEPGGGKERSRTLTEEELRRLHGFVADNHVDDLAPMNQQAWDGVQFEYIHLTRDGGRRVFMNNPGIGESTRTVYDRLTRLFQRIAASAPTHVAYAALEGIAGAKIILSDEKNPIATVWADGDDLRVYIGRYGDGQWHAMKNDAIGEKVDPPSGFLPPLKDSSGKGDEGQAQDEPPGLPINAGLNRSRWKITAGADSFWAGEPFSQLGPMEGIWRWRKGEKPQRLTKDKMDLLRPVVTPDGKWIVAELCPDDRNQPHPLMRIRASDGETKQLDLPPRISFETVAYVAEHAKVLVQGIDLDKPGDQRERFWLVDPASGAVQEVTGEFGPLLDQNIRPLQAASPRKESKSNAALYWAALPTRLPEPATTLGLYDAVHFKFSPMVKLPGLQFSSMRMWVRERSDQDNAGNAGASTAFIAINGDLISVPLSGDRH